MLDICLGGTKAISVSSWRHGQRLAKIILGPAPKVEQQDNQPLVIDRTGRERFTNSGKLSFLKYSFNVNYITFQMTVENVCIKIGL